MRNVCDDWEDGKDKNFVYKYNTNPDNIVVEENNNKWEIMSTFDCDLHKLYLELLSEVWQNGFIYLHQLDFVLLLHLQYL